MQSFLRETRRTRVLFAPDSSKAARRPTDRGSGHDGAAGPQPSASSLQPAPPRPDPQSQGQTHRKPRPSQARPGGPPAAAGGQPSRREPPGRAPVGRRPPGCWQGGCQPALPRPNNRNNSARVTATGYGSAPVRGSREEPRDGPPFLRHMVCGGRPGTPRRQTQASFPWQALYFLPLPQGQGSLRPTFGTGASDSSPASASCETLPSSLGCV